MTYEEALQYIHAVSWKGSVPGLERITELMGRLGNPEKGLKFIHIVGTNGKGSTAATLASVLTGAGYRTGLFISPYVIDFRERMQLNGEMISREALAAETEAVRPFAEAMADPPTEFELITGVALRWFADEKADIVVLEAGMGSELDATTVPAGTPHTTSSAWFGPESAASGFPWPISSRNTSNGTMPVSASTPFMHSTSAGMDSQ